MSTISSGVRHLTATRILKAVAGLLTHALLCMYFGVEGYGVLGIALGILGFLKVFSLNTAAALQTFIPLLQAEGAGQQARKLSLLAYLANAAVSLVTSVLLLLASGPLAADSPALSGALAGLAAWNLLPALRGPVDADLMMGLRWYRPLLLFRALEYGAGVPAAALTWILGGNQNFYFLLLFLLSLPATLFCLGLIPSWRKALPGNSPSPSGGIRRFLRFCLPLTLSQGLYRVYASVGAPLLGALLSVQAAGLYKFTLTIAENAVDFLAVVSQAYHPALARARARGRDQVGRLYRQAVNVTLVLTVPAILALILGSEWIAWCLSRGKFSEAAPLIEIMAIQVFLRTVSAPATRVLFVYEKTFTVMGLSAAKLTLEVIAFVVLLGPFGVAGAAWAHVGAAVPVAAAVFLLARRCLGTGAGGVAGLLMRELGLLVSVWMTARFLGPLLLPASPLRVVLMAALLGYTWYCLTRRIRGTPAESFLREGVLRGWPVIGRLPLRPGEPVTLVTNSRSLGGVERHVEDLATGLHRAGIPYQLLCPETPAVNSWARRMEKAGAGRVIRTGVAAPWDLPGMWRTFRAIRKTRGLLHFHLNSPDDQAPGLLLAAAAGRRPILATVHLNRKDRPPLLSPKGFRRRVSLPVPDRILTVSEDLRQDLVKEYPLLPGCVQAIRNGIDPDAFSADPEVGRRFRRSLNIPEETFVLLFVGRLTRVKGVDVLLAALARMEAPRPDLLVVGEGPEEAALMEEAKHLQVPVRFLGWQDCVKPVFSAADAFVLPSRYEGLPLVVAEAMAAGLPVVATAVCGTPEIVKDGETGILVPAENARALGQAISRLVKLSPAERRKMGAAGLERARSHFHVNRQTAEVLEVYSHLGIEVTSRPGGMGSEMIQQAQDVSDPRTLEPMHHADSQS